MSLKSKYQKDGYGLLKQAISKPLLLQLKSMANELEEQALSQSRQQLETTQIAFDCLNNPKHVLRINDVYRSHYKTINNLLSAPKVINAIIELAGNDAIPLSADIQFKTNLSVSVIPWHQDSVFDRKHAFFAMGVYLDDAHEDDGCLRYVPGSQSHQQDVNRLATLYGWNIPKMQQMPASAGDILFHDAMTLHGSSMKSSPGYRRTLYIEFRPWQAIMESNTHSAKWVELRRRWIQSITQITNHRTQQSLECSLAQNNLSCEFFEEIYRNKETSTLSNWAIPPVQRNDYPL